MMTTYKLYNGDWRTVVMYMFPSTYNDYNLYDISVQCGVPDLACDVNKLYYIYYLYLLSFLVLHWTFVMS